MVAYTSMWAVGLVAVLLAFSAGGATAVKPVVRVKSNQVKTILSMDGGAARGGTVVRVLHKLETSIKTAMMDLDLPETRMFKHTDEFDIYLSDYFDLIAGTSVGSIMATYLATHTQIPLLPRAGTVDALQGFLYGIFIVPVPVNASETAENYFQWGVARRDNAYNNLFTPIFKNLTLQDFDSYHAPLLVAMTDINYGTVSMFSDPDLKQAGTYIPKPATHEPSPFNLNRNFYIRDLLAGSSAAPKISSPVELSSIPPTPENDTYQVNIMDGAMSGDSPVASALAYMLKKKEVPLCDIAILSLGCPDINGEYPRYTSEPEPAGEFAYFKDYNDTANQVATNWLFPWRVAKQATVNLLNEIVDAAINDCQHEEPHFLRIQKFFSYKNITTSDDPDRYKRQFRAAIEGQPYQTLLEIGNDLAEEYEEELYNFAKNILLAEFSNPKPTKPKQALYSSSRRAL